MTLEPKTHAQETRQRRDIVSGAVMPEHRLIRFVSGPGGELVPDLGRKLPGRGLWVAAERSAIEIAARKGLFSRAAKQRLTPGDDLAAQVDQLLFRRLLDGLGLARRAGALIFGLEKVASAIREGKVGWMVEALDGAEDGRGKLLALARHQTPRPGLLGLFTSDEMGLALGGGNVIHTAFLAGRACSHWSLDVERLSGFRSLLPESWREEP